MWINTVRDAGKVSRWHTRRMLFDQDIAQHSFNALFITLEIMEGVLDINRERVLIYISSHDIPEIASGDAPGSAKSDHPELKRILDEIEDEWVKENCPAYIQDAFNNLTKKEKVICKLADLLEALYSSVIEVRIGNDALKPAVKQIWEALSEKLMEAKEIDLTVEDNADKILVWIESEYDSEIMKSIGEDN